MTITIFQILRKDETLKRIENRLKSAKIPPRTEVDAQGTSVDLRTSIERVKRLDTVTGSIMASIKYDFMDNYVDHDGTQKSAIKARTVYFAFVSNPAIYLLIFAPKGEAGKTALKISRAVYNEASDPILTCNIRPAAMQKFINKYRPVILSCSWKDLDLLNVDGASVRGSSIEDTSDFQRFDSRGEKNSLRMRVPTLGVTMSINREASMHVYTKMEDRDQILLVKQHILNICS